MKTLGRVYTVLIEGLASLAGLLIAGVCLLIVYDVIARNLGLQPPDSTVALTEYALLYFTMAAAPWLVRTRGHIVVEVLHSRLAGRVRARTDRLILVICIATSALIAVLATQLAVEAATRGEVEIRSLAVPRVWLFLPLAIGFALMATEFLRLLVRGEAAVDPEKKGSAL